MKIVDLLKIYSVIRDFNSVRDPVFRLSELAVIAELYEEILAIENLEESLVVEGVTADITNFFYKI